MAFSKSFPKKGTRYPEWEEVYLTLEEEIEQEKLSRKENINLMKQSIEDAKSILTEKKLKPYQSDVINMAIALFGKTASHQIYWKEGKAKEKFDNK
ncbi:MAG: hypothetical protein PHT54_00120 [Candidatus Nanoarchaeia archaeon]|nr:hypothetical protein [Candidatus Nanoarchaeia archaeon]